MGVVLPQQGKKSFLTDVKSSSAGFSLRLFKNSITPGQLSVYGDFQQADFSGYSSTTLAWGTISIDVSGRASMTATSATYAHNGGGTSNTVYGYYLVHSITNEVLFAELFTSPKTMAVFGDSITITPTMTLDQG